MSAVVDGVGDAVIIERSCRDAEAFGALYDRYAGQLYRYAYRRVGELAEDVVANTFLAAFRRRHEYDLAQPSARPWLFGILVKEIAGHHRAEQARYRALAKAGTTGIADGLADHVAARVTASAAGPGLADGLRRLSTGDRDVLLLIAWSAMSYDEVAEALHIKIGTVRSRLHRARRILREALRGAGISIEEER